MESIINIILKYDINLLLSLTVIIMILLLLHADIFDDPNLTSN